MIAPASFWPLAIAEREQAIAVTIADDGIGLPATEGASLVARFRRGDLSRHVDGAGLGLSLVATIAERHGIRWRFEKRDPGVAVVFEFVA